MKLPMTNGTSDDTGEACTGCDRRAFLRAGLGAGLALTVLGLDARSAGALTTRWITGSAQAEKVRYDVPVEDGVHVDRKTEVIVVRHQGTIAAFALSCPHQRSMLKWREKDGYFQCTKHHSHYGPLGVFEDGRATRNMDRYAVSLVNGALVVDTSTVFQSDEQPAAWAAATVVVP